MNMFILLVVIIVAASILVALKQRNPRRPRVLPLKAGTH